MKFGNQWGIAGAIALCTIFGSPTQAGNADANIAAWLGYEITIQESEQVEHVPQGGKLTLIYDSGDDVYRACARATGRQKGKWKADWTAPCGVTLNFVSGQRYCTLSDVKAGNAEVLSSCHRLRSSEVAMHESTVAGGMELHDVIVFLLEPTAGKRGGIAILLDSPARVTHDGIIHGEPD